MDTHNFGNMTAPLVTVNGIDCIDLLSVISLVEMTDCSPAKL